MGSRIVVLGGWGGGIFEGVWVGGGLGMVMGMAGIVHRVGST